MSDLELILLFITLHYLFTSIMIFFAARAIIKAIKLSTVILLKGDEDEKDEEEYGSNPNNSSSTPVDTDSDGAINQYQTSTQVNNNWNNVISVRITLLVNTIKERLDQEEDTGTYVLDPNLTYNSNGAPIDHRRRIIFTTTVMLRNNSTTM